MAATRSAVLSPRNVQEPGFLTPVLKAPLARTISTPADEKAALLRTHSKLKACLENLVGASPETRAAAAAAATVELHALQATFEGDSGLTPEQLPTCGVPAWPENVDLRAECRRLGGALVQLCAAAREEVAALGTWELLTRAASSTYAAAEGIQQRLLEAAPGALAAFQESLLAESPAAFGSPLAPAPRSPFLAVPEVLPFSPYALRTPEPAAQPPQPPKRRPLLRLVKLVAKLALLGAAGAAGFVVAEKERLKRATPIAMPAEVEVPEEAAPEELSAVAPAVAA